MFTLRIVGAFVSFSLIVGCAQTPPRESLPQMAMEVKSEAATTVKSVGKVDSKIEIIEQIMVESGLNYSIEQLPDAVAMGFDQQPPPPIDNNKRMKFREHLIKAHDTEKFKKSVKDYLSEHYDAKRFSELLTLLKTPLVQKMTALENEAQTPESQQGMMQRGNLIMSQAAPERLDLARQLEEVVKATESGVIVQMMLVTVTMTNLNKIVPVAQQITQAQVMQNLEQIRAQSMYPMRQFMHLFIVHAYRSVSDEELQQYIALYKTNIGQWSIDLLNNAMIKASEGVANDLETRLEKEFVVSNAL